MKERPIIMGTESVQGILDGRKTHTRRVMKEPWRVYLPQAVRGDGPLSATRAEPGLYDAEHNRNGAVSVKATSNSRMLGIKPAEFEWVCPYGQVGDHLWVKETFAKFVKGCPQGVSYRADHLDPKGDGPAHPITWRSPLFMPRSLCRLTLEIVSIKVERLQDITDEGALAEGVDRTNTSIPTYAIQRYRKLWDSLNTKRGFPWDANPFVWDISFRRID